MSIDLNAAPEQQQILASVRTMLEGRFPVARLRKGSPSGHGTAELLAAIVEFGGFALWRSEDDGGAGLTILEEALLHVEFGRFLVTPAALAAALAGRLAAETGKASILDAIAGGDARVALASPAVAIGSGPADASFIDWEGADLALLWRSRDLVLLDMKRLSVSPAKAADHSVTFGRGAIEDGAMVAASAAGSRLPALARLLLSAQFLGMAQAARDLAADYAKVRTQFGAPIGSFQAVKHRCADMAIRAEVLEAQLAFAAIAQRDGWPDADFQIDACRMIAARYALENAASDIQVHGGVGFTSEADPHLYLLRARLLENLGGGLQSVQDDFMTRRGFASAGS